MKLPVVFLLSVLASAQSKSPNSIQTKGVCSPVITGSGNTVNIKTCGPEQGDEFRRLLKALASNQQTDTATILKRLDGCFHTMADRHLTDNQKAILVSAMGPFKGELVEIVTLAGNPEAYHFAKDFVDVFIKSEVKLSASLMGGRR